VAAHLFEILEPNTSSYFTQFFPKDFHELPASQKKWTFSGIVLCFDSENMLNVANGPILA
jgi:hypothetical protein